MSEPLRDPSEINQRDLKNRASEIMDAIERGESFTLTRHGHRIATVTPISRRRTFVSSERVAAAFAGAPILDDRKFAEDVSAAFDEDDYDPYDRARRVKPAAREDDE